MTNEERKRALNRARKLALEHAETAQEQRGYSELPITLANMWARVAEALKDGDPAHDAADGHSLFQQPTITR